MSTAVSASAARVYGGNVEAGVAVNSSGDFLVFLKGGPSAGNGWSIGVEGGGNEGSFNDLVATEAGVEWETQVAGLGLSISRV